jgi:hypothetical protein
MVTKLDARGICRRLLDAESEADVQTVIDSVPEMANAKNWRPLDNRETNLNVTSNQASAGGKALTALMTHGRRHADEACAAQGHRPQEQ